MANRRYLSDYAFRDPENKKAGVEYVGRYYYRIATDKEHFRKLKIRYFLFWGGEALLYAASGFLSNPGMFTFYEALPYAVNFLPVFLAFVACIDIALSPLEMTRKAADIAVKRLKNATVASFILSLMCAISSAGVMLTAGKGGFSWREVCFFALQASLGVIGYLFMGVQGKAGMETVPNPAYTDGSKRIDGTV